MSLGQTIHSFSVFTLDPLRNGKAMPRRRDKPCKAPGSLCRQWGRGAAKGNKDEWGAWGTQRTWIKFFLKKFQK